MNKQSVVIKDWPFEKDQKVKLIWIGEPFKKDNKWVIYAYFCYGNQTKKVLLNWADVHFLTADKFYTNGELNSNKTISGIEIIDIDFSNITGKYHEKTMELKVGDCVESLNSKTLNFKLNGVLYTIPFIEIIRSVIAPDGFNLNRILELNSLENYFTYEFIDESLVFNFTSDYDINLLKDDKKVLQLAWLVSNPDVLKMFNAAGTMMFEKKEMGFNFNLSNFKVRAKVVRTQYGLRVLQILYVKGKNINAYSIIVNHPRLERVDYSEDGTKCRMLVKASDSGIIVDTETDGASKAKPEIIDTFMISHEYINPPSISRIKNKERVTSKYSDQSTKICLTENERLRTTADNGGTNVCRSLEFSNLSDEIPIANELIDFMNIIKCISKKEEVKTVNICSGEFDGPLKNRSFSRLQDGITKRKYAIGKVLMLDGRENCIIDIEREGKSLSMLLILSKKHENWKYITGLLLEGLINESGTWSSKNIDSIESQGLKVLRKKHTKANILDRAEQIYNVIR